MTAILCLTPLDAVSLNAEQPPECALQRMASRVFELSVVRRLGWTPTTSGATSVPMRRAPPLGAAARAVSGSPIRVAANSPGSSRGARDTRRRQSAHVPARVEGSPPPCPAARAATPWRSGEACAQATAPLPPPSPPLYLAATRRYISLPPPRPPFSFVFRGGRRPGRHLGYFLGRFQWESGSGLMLRRAKVATMGARRRPRTGPRGWKLRARPHGRRALQEQQEAGRRVAGPSLQGTRGEAFGPIGGVRHGTRRL
eukprot:scaffold142043_cov24-Tisochrysis_lutea.AAC.2